MSTQGTLFEIPAAVPMVGGAMFSEDGVYRYTLSRRWGAGGICNFLMLNPSTADADKPDPTITRCIRFARDWGYAGLDVTNLFAYRSTDPDALRGVADPIGPENDGWILATASKAAIVVCGWGAHPAAVVRGAAVLAMLRDDGVRPYCLARTQSDAPGHPLFLKADRRPVPFDETPPCGS